MELAPYVRQATGLGDAELAIAIGAADARHLNRHGLTHDVFFGAGETMSSAGLESFPAPTLLQVLDDA